MLGVVSAAALLALAITWLAIPRLIPYARQWSLMDHPGGRKLHRDATPLVGGVAMAAGMLAGGLLFSAVTNAFHSRITEWPFLGAVAAGATLLFVVGVLDDRHVLGPMMKLAAQVVAVVPLLVFTPARSPDWVPVWLWNTAGFLWLLTNANTFNLLDGLDGLMGSVALLCTLAFAVLAWATGEWGALLIVALLGGALAGFLPWNLPPARTFAGDAGSLVVGYLLAAVSLRIMSDGGAGAGLLLHPHVAMAPLLVLAVPLYELFSIVWVRIREGRRLFSGDTSHLAHRLLRRGLSPLQAVGAISLCTLLTAFAGVLLAGQGPATAVPVILLCAGAACLLAWLEWPRRAPARRRAET